MKYRKVLVFLSILLLMTMTLTAQKQQKKAELPPIKYKEIKLKKRLARDYARRPFDPGGRGQFMVSRRLEK